MDVAKSDPTNLEARSPQPGRSGFLNSKEAANAAGPGAAVPGRPGTPSGPGIAAPLGPRSLASLFASIGFSLAPEKIGAVQDRVMAALSLIAARSPLGQEKAAASFQERVAATYRRAQASFAAESGHAGRARSLAVLDGLFVGAGLDLGAEGLASLSSDLEGGGSGGGAAGGEGFGGESRDSAGSNEEGGAGYEASANSGGQGKPGVAASAGRGDAEDAEAELGAFERMAKDFFHGSGDGPNDWQAFNERARALDPGWSLVPFGFTAGNVEFSGYFRVLCHKRERAVLSLGADFRSNGHFYSFTLRGSDLALEGPELTREDTLRAVDGLGRALAGLGLDLSYSGFAEAEPGQGAWA